MLQEPQGGTSHRAQTSKEEGTAALSPNLGHGGAQEGYGEGADTTTNSGAGPDSFYSGEEADTCAQELFPDPRQHTEPMTPYQLGNASTTNPSLTTIMESITRGLAEALHPTIESTSITQVDPALLPTGKLLKWLYAFRDTKKEKEWDDKKAIEQLLRATKGAGRFWLAKVDRAVGFERIARGLRDHFVPECKLLEYKAKIQDRAQRQGESASTFIRKQQAKWYRVKPDITDEKLVRKIRSKLHSGLATYLLPKNIRTIDKLIEKSTMYEQANRELSKSKAAPSRTSREATACITGNYSEEEAEEPDSKKPRYNEELPDAITKAITMAVEGALKERPSQASLSAQHQPDMPATRATIPEGTYTQTHNYSTDGGYNTANTTGTNTSDDAGNNSRYNTGYNGRYNSNTGYNSGYNTEHNRGYTTPWRTESTQQWRTPRTQWGTPGRFPRATNQTRGRICANCDEPGHYWAACPKPCRMCDAKPIHSRYACRKWAADHPVEYRKYLAETEKKLRDAQACAEPEPGSLSPMCGHAIGCCSVVDANTDFALGGAYPTTEEVDENIALGGAFIKSTDGHIALGGAGLGQVALGGAHTRESTSHTTCQTLSTGLAEMTAQRHCRGDVTVNDHFFDGATEVCIGAPVGPTKIQSHAFSGKVNFFKGTDRIPLPSVWGEIAGVRMAIALDSCANISLMDEPMFRRLQWKNKSCAHREPWCGTITGVGGKAQCTGCSKLLNWGEAYFKSRTITCGQSTEALLEKAEEYKTVLTCLSDITLYPGQITEVLVFPDNPADTGKSIEVRASTKLDKNLVLSAGAITVGENRLGTVQIHNQGSEETVIHQGEPVAVKKDRADIAKGDASIGSAQPRGEQPPKGKEGWNSAEVQWENLTPRQREAFRALQEEFADILTNDRTKLGRTTLMEHHIPTKVCKAAARPEKKFTPKEEVVIGKEIQEMLRIDVIAPGKSEWVAPLSISQKKDGSMRLCTNYRALNKETLKDNYPLPNVFETLQALSGNSWFSTLDMMSGFWQVPIAKEDIHKTGFVCKQGQFTMKVMHRTEKPAVATLSTSCPAPVSSGSTPVEPPRASVPEGKITHSTRVGEGPIIVISDLHMGTVWLGKNAQVHVLELLNKIGGGRSSTGPEIMPNTKCVVFAGDIGDNSPPNSLSLFFSYLFSTVDLWVHSHKVEPPSFRQLWEDDFGQKMMNAIKVLLSRGIHVVYVAGNHDMNVTKSDIDGLFGADAIEFVEATGYWFSEETINGMNVDGRVIVAHGHQSDIFNTAAPSEGKAAHLPFGYFVSRLAATSARTETVSWYLKWAINKIPENMWEGVGCRIQNAPSVKPLITTDPRNAMVQNPWFLIESYMLKEAGGLKRLQDTNLDDWNAELRETVFRMPGGVTMTLGEVLSAYEGVCSRTDRDKGFAKKQRLIDFFLEAAMPWIAHLAMRGGHAAPVVSVTDGLKSGAQETVELYAEELHNEAEAMNKVVVMGHTHTTICQKKLGYIYVNSGGWVPTTKTETETTQYTFVEILQDSSIRTHFWSQQGSWKFSSTHL
ncbi:Transposon Ty3-I Gag-Pol polyprotein [Pelomyxa schiedti]|nr:Transposon Ty3-I Gag-Pol polyprotein [Pelomyxa schiedti]